MWAKRTYSTIHSGINGKKKELGRTRGTLDHVLSGEESDIRALNEAESTTGHEDTDIWTRLAYARTTCDDVRAPTSNDRRATHTDARDVAPTSRAGERGLGFEDEGPDARARSCGR